MRTRISSILYFVIVLLVGLSLGRTAYSGTLSCSVTTAAACTGTVILRMSDVTNAHAELPSQSTAAYASSVICCTGVSSLSSACTAPSAVVLRLAGTTNAHVEKNSEANANYTSNACMSVPTGGTVSVGYQAENCTGFDTTLGSLSGTTNAHIGSGTAYTTKICGTATGSYATSGYLISSTFDTAATNGVAYNTFVWHGTKPINTSVKLQLATSNSSTGPWTYLGSDCTAFTYYTPESGTASLIQCYSNHNNKRYFKYKVFLETSDPAATPQVDDIIVNFSQ